MHHVDTGAVTKHCVRVAIASAAKLLEGPQHMRWEPMIENLVP